MYEFVNQDLARSTNMVYRLVMPTNTNQLTAKTITTRQIKALREEALTAGDYRTVDTCDVALADHETANNDGTPLVGSDGQPTTRTDARAILADAFNEAAAMGDSQAVAS